MSFETYDPRFFQRLSAIERTHFWYVARRRIVRSALRSVAASEHGAARVLEVGCGTGGMLELLRNVAGPRSTVGFDLHLEGLLFARSRSGTSLVAGDLSRTPFRSRFDVVTLLDVLEHLPDDVGTLRQIGRLLSPSGILVLTVPASPGLWSYFDEAARHRRRYVCEDLAAKLSDAGLIPDYVSPVFAAYYPLVWLYRRFRGGPSGVAPGPDGAHDQALDDLSPPRLVNGLLSALTAFEPALVRRRIRLPFGTSLLAIARKQP